MTDQTDRVTVPWLVAAKERGHKISMVTAYDYPAALLIDAAGIDVALVGDSVGREVLGYENELGVTMDDMAHHVRAVRRGLSRALLLADMPFLSYQVNADEALRNAGRLIQAGANAVKIETTIATAPTLARLVDAGIPVMAHVGFRPQSVNQTGVGRQGKDKGSADEVLEDAVVSQDAGAFAVLLELVPADLAHRVTETLHVPTIGIGAGPHCGGQVLVFGDLIGLRIDRPLFRHARAYASVGEQIVAALRSYKSDVEAGKFPS
jgi:3-methyl-2-oxobutanoate hydroxymethyltransferase